MAIRRRGHVDRINSFIVVWCGDEQEQIGFDGEVFNLPPMDTEAVVEPGSPYKFEGARDREGRLIPGTIRVSDRHAIIEGNRTRVFDSDMFVKWTETIRVDLLDRGLVIVDLPEEVEDAKAHGRPLYEASQDMKARSVLEAELFRRRRWEEKGTPAPPSSHEHLVVWAIKHLNERGTALSLIPTDQITGALSKGLPPRAAIEGAMRGRPAQRDFEAPAASTAEGMSLFAKAKALGVKMNKDELEGLLADEDGAVGTVRQKVKEKELQIKEMEEEATAAAP
jgi:hypothetical protein